MIVFVCTADHQYTLRELLERKGSVLNGQIALLSQDEFLHWPELPVGNYVMADLERADPDTRQALHDRLEQLRKALPGLRVLNDPLTSLGRIDLLTKLHGMGINSFRIFSAETLPEDLPDQLDPPMFVRGAEDHEGARGGLLRDKSALMAEIAALSAPPTGLEKSAIAVTEYVDVRNTAGYHEKYSVFRLGDRLFSVTYDVSHNWVNKGYEADFVSVDYAKAEFEFVKNNPHSALLAPIFEAAGISYGRVDYAFTQDDPEQTRPQVFEINTNPMIETPVSCRPEWAEASLLFNTLYEEAFLEWDRFAPLSEESHRRMVRVAGARPGDPPSPFGRGRTMLRRFLRRIGRLDLETRVMGGLLKLFKRG